MATINNNTIQKLRKENANLDVMFKMLINFMDNNDLIGFKSMYEIFENQRKKTSKIAKCNYKYPEIEEYAKLNNL